MDITGVTWRKSTRSNGSGNCVEVASTDTAVAVRDTKDRNGGTLIFTAACWAAFITRSKRGTFDRTD